MPEQLSREEFLAHIGYVRDDIRSVHSRLDALNGRTRTIENEVAVLKSQATKDPAARWGAVGAGVAGTVAAVWQWFKG